MATQTQTFTASGTWTCPADTCSVAVEAYGGGGGGNNGVDNASSGGGGGSGAYAKKNSVAVSPGVAYAVTVGAQASAGTDGHPSLFVGDGGDTCLAAAGTHGVPNNYNNGLLGSTADSTGDVKYRGGYGGPGGGASGYGGGGGGGGAGNANNGGSGDNGGAGYSGEGAAGGMVGGGTGGHGGFGSLATAGSTYGGGGGGGSSANSRGVAGGAGAAGAVILTWTPILYNTFLWQDF